MRSFLPWALLLLLARGAIMLALGDAFFYGEELEKATAAKAMLDGLNVPHHQLAYHYYEGGGFVISHLKALAFLVFGETLFANKVVAIASCLGVLGAGWWACGRAFGPTASRFFAALYIAAPATVQKLSLVSLGIHHEACIFILLALGITATLMESQRRWPSVFLGVCLGFGVYFSWVLALAAFACGASLVYRWRRRLDPACVGLCFVGGLVGSTPLLIMYAIVGGDVFNIHGTELAASGSSLSISLRDFLRSIYVDGALGGRVGAFAWPSAILLAVIIGVDRVRTQADGWSRSFWCFLAFVVVFIAGYLSSAFVQGAVYHFFLMLRLVPLWAVGIALLAGVLGRAWDNEERAAPVVWLSGALALLGLQGLCVTIADGRPMDIGKNWRLLQEERGYVYSSYFQKRLPHLDGGKEEKLAVLLGFKESEEALLRESIASELFRRNGISLEEDYAECSRVVEAVEPGRFSDYQRGLGPLLVSWLGSNPQVGLEGLQAAGPDAGVLSEALGRTGRGLHPPGEAPSLEGSLSHLVEELTLVDGHSGAPAYARGVGWRLHLLLHRTVYQPWRAEAVIGTAPDSLRGPFREGYQAATRAGRFPSGA